MKIGKIYYNDKREGCEQLDIDEVGRYLEYYINIPKRNKTGTFNCGVERFILDNLTKKQNGQRYFRSFSG
ncbi:hypothetical protein FACS189465_2450 [Clostridia bacterium]|nr:hypothetical protein FACS189465_2450 [Clostridia bacterium]